MSAYLPACAWRGPVRLQENQIFLIHQTLGIFLLLFEWATQGDNNATKTDFFPSTSDDNKRGRVQKPFLILKLTP